MLSISLMQREFQVQVVWLLCHLPSLQSAGGLSHLPAWDFFCIGLGFIVFEYLTPCFHRLCLLLQVPSGIV